MVSKKIIALALVLVAFCIIGAGCCCGSSGTGTSDLDKNDNVAYTGKTCTTNSNCQNGQDGWYCSAGKCAKSSSSSDPYSY